MLPIIELFHTPVSGAAITWDGSDEPVFATPFPKLDHIGAFAIDDETVLFVAARLAQSGDKDLSTLLASYDLRQRRTLRRAELREVRSESAMMSVDKRTLYLTNFSGITAIDTGDLSLRRCMQLYRTDSDAGAVTSFAELDREGQATTWPAHERCEAAQEAGWQRILITSDSILRDLDQDSVAQFHPGWHSKGPEPRTYWQQYEIFDWRRGSARSIVFRSEAEPTALDRMDQGARLFYVSRRLLGVFFPSAPARVGDAGPPVDDASPKITVLLWRIDQPEVAPMLIRVRDDAKPGVSLRTIYEDPRDGVLWLSFTDGCIRGLDGEGRLGPLVVLSDGFQAGTRASRFVRPDPIVTFRGPADVVVEKGPFMARHVFRVADMAGKAGPVTLVPARSGPLSRRHAKAFAAFVRERRRDRFALPDWSRDGIAAALDAQRAAVAAGLPDLVDEEDRLTFAYKVAGRPVKEAAFFRRIAKDALPVVPELRALLLAYTDALGTGGEGVQPWQDPDEAVGGLGPALRTLALLDPDCLDVLRAYLETRDGEHEDYCLDTVVPAFFECHGWRDAAAVRFGIYATLNRYWGGRQPPEGFDGMWEAMALLLTPGEAAEAVLREAEYFGQKPDWGDDAAAYRAAFRSLLDTANPYEAAVRDALTDASPVD